MSTNSNTSKFERALAYVIVVLAVIALFLSFNSAFPRAYALGPERNEHECASPKFIDGRVQYVKSYTLQGDLGVRYAGCPDQEEDNVLASLTQWIVATLTSTPDSTSTSVPTQTSTNTPVVTSTPPMTTTSVPTQVTNTPVVTPTVVVTSTPNPTNTPMPTETEKAKCNKGEGNGGEGCDPGNNPDKGNNDED